jgi:glutathione S-transferase
MKLLTSAPSPFGRKVLVVAHETGLVDRIEVIYANPWSPETTVPSVNPVGKVPALVTDEGMALYDSSVIAEFLDTLAGGRLYPGVGADRWLALRRAKLADQMLDAFIAVRLERNRPSGEQSLKWIERQSAIVRRCLDAMEQDVAAYGSHLDIGHIATAVALAHLDFRRGAIDMEWRDDRRALTAWYESFARRPSMQRTVPHD